MYGIADYWKMMGDHVRRDAYAEALRRTVKPGAVVLNIGTGTGIFAILACRAGAGRVYAIEDDDIIEVARALAATNEVQDRIEFIQGLSTDVTLPEQADVIVSDLRGVLPLHGHHIPSIADARRRFLAPGGALIPQRDAIWAAVVEAPDLYRLLVAPWGQNPPGLDFEAARRLAVNRWSKATVGPDQLLVEPRPWATLEYDRIESAAVSGDLGWVAARRGIAHGLCVWFVATLADGVSFSCAPDQPERIYGSGFFPWEDPVALAAGDFVSASLQADLVGDDYVWRWASRIHAGGEGGELKAEFQQSNFYAAPISPTVLRRGSVDLRPHIDESGEVDRAILGLMNGELTLRAIADRISLQFPAVFPGRDEALPRVQHLSRRYSR